MNVHAKRHATRHVRLTRSGVRVRRMSVDDAWGRIVAWCEINAPVTFQGLRPPAGAHALAATEARFRREWPADLRRWYELQDGVDFLQFDAPLPHWTAHPLAEIQSGDDGIGSAEEVAEGEQSPAGSMAWLWVPSFVEIAHDITASRLFVDLRPGELRGCVTMWDRDEGALDEPHWASVSEMLEQTASSLELGVACAGFRPVVEDGALGWDYDL
jgi:cell wall assembly regulator SMI1